MLTERETFIYRRKQNVEVERLREVEKYHEVLNIVCDHFTVHCNVKYGHKSLALDCTRYERVWWGAGRDG